jgi:YVTN family beta-propeller protein
VTVPATATENRLEFRILGPLEVFHDGEEVRIAGSRQRALLAYLLLHANEVVSSERLIDELFGEEPPDNALNSVHAGVSRLRRQLATGGVSEAAIVTRPPGYLLEVKPRDFDLDRFEQLTERGRRQLEEGGAEAAAETLRGGLAIWRGPPLAELAGYEFARAESARLEGLRLAALLERIEADLALGRHAELIPELEALAAEHPLEERVRGQLMLALYRAGRQAAALQAYQDIRRVLVAELGLEPGKPLQRLEQRILTQDPELDPPVPGRPQPGPATARPSRRLVVTFVAAMTALTAGLATSLALLARDDGAAALAAIAPNSVGVIDPSTNSLQAEIPVGEGPMGIAATADAVWVANSADASVTRIDPMRRVSVRTIVLAGRPSDIAVDRNVWVLHNREPATVHDPYVGSAFVSEINSNFNFVAQTIPVGEGFGNIFEDPVEVQGGSVWAGGVTGVSRIDATTGSVGTRARLYGVSDLHVRRGELWAAYVGGGIASIDASGTTVLYDIPLSSKNLPVGLAGANGSLWVVAIGEAGTLFKVDPVNREVIARRRIGGYPIAIAAGFGSLWVADRQRRAVLRIDPETIAVVARIPLDATPSAIATGAGAVWVTVT